MPESSPLPICGVASGNPLNLKTISLFLWGVETITAASVLLGSVLDTVGQQVSGTWCCHDYLAPFKTLQAYTSFKSKPLGSTNSNLQMTRHPVPVGREQEGDGISSLQASSLSSQ